MQDAAVPCAEALDQAVKTWRPDQGVVRRQDEERFDVVAQGLHPGPHRGEHPGVVAGVVDRADRQPLEDGRDRVGVMPGHDDDVADVRPETERDHPFDHRLGAERQQGLARAHARPGRAG